MRMIRKEVYAEPILPWTKQQLADRIGELEGHLIEAEELLLAWVTIKDNFSCGDPKATKAFLERPDK